MKVLLIFACVSSSQAVVEEYTTNAICRKHNCINPVFPALDGLVRVQDYSWECPDSSPVKYLEFCSGIVNYDFSVISKSQSKATNTSDLASRVKELDDAASTAYFYHLAGMNVEAWDHTEPSKSDPCIQAVWKLACFTFLPKAKACKSGQTLSYKLPCSDVCRKYTETCSVECCDESVQCQDTSFAPPYEKFTGYAEHGCTGFVGGARTGAPLAAGLLLALLSLLSSSIEVPRCRASTFLFILCLAVVALQLQGCDILGMKELGNWESKPGYFPTFSYNDVVDPQAAGTSLKSTASLNSCYSQVKEYEKCSGHGKCLPFKGLGRNNSESLAEKSLSGETQAVLFCQCDRDYFDPECRTRRKSQRTAFALSCFAGFLGMDRFYLGELGTGSAKLASLGGAGIWWARDVVWIGSGPIYTQSHGRLAADLPHWAFVLLAVAWAALVSYLIFGVWGFVWHQHKLLEKALLQAERGLHDVAKRKHAPTAKEAEAMLGMPGRASYHLLAPPPGPEEYYGTMAAAAPQVKLAAYKNPLSPFYSYAKASENPTVVSSGAFQRPTAAVPPLKPEPVPSDLL